MRIVTDNGANYRARTFTATITSLASRHQRTRPYSSQQQRRDAVAVWNHQYHYHRPHTTCHNQPPATHVPAHITNIMTSYT